jgi:crotonobetainyl-CoA:carnitine CoA-transferase CaiB-like acyl-CoA transferase
MSGPLSGVVIADFAQLAQGPFATQILGDLGADIIKIEPPKGDWMRYFAYGNLYPAGESVSYLAFNRNKRSITLNLKIPKGVEVAKRLVTKADVVVENFRPGVMERLGLGYDTLSQLNPRLIYCASSGFGPSGPYAKRAGQDLLIQAMTGFLSLNGRQGEPPVPAAVGVADLVTGLHIVYGVIAALYSREQTGQGQRVDACLLNSLLGLQIQELTAYLNSNIQPARSKTGIPNPWLGAPYGLYKTADGYIAIAMNSVKKLADLVGLAGYEDEEYESNNVIQKRDEISVDFAAIFLQKTTAEWLEVLLAEDIWCGPVYKYADVEQDPQIAANEMLISYEHPTAGTVRTVGIPVKFQGTPGTIARPAPQLGEHTDEILREFGGYTPAEIRELRHEQAFG